MDGGGWQAARARRSEEDEAATLGRLIYRDSKMTSRDVRRWHQDVQLGKKTLNNLRDGLAQLPAADGEDELDLAPHSTPKLDDLRERLGLAQPSGAEQAPRLLVTRDEIGLVAAVPGPGDRERLPNGTGLLHCGNGQGCYRGLDGRLRESDWQELGWQGQGLGWCRQTVVVMLVVLGRPVDASAPEVWTALGYSEPKSKVEQALRRITCIAVARLGSFSKRGNDRPLSGRSNGGKRTDTYAITPGKGVEIVMVTPTLDCRFPAHDPICLPSPAYAGRVCRLLAEQWIARTRYLAAVEGQRRSFP